MHSKMFSVPKLFCNFVLTKTKKMRKKHQIFYLRFDLKLAYPVQCTFVTGFKSLLWRDFLQSFASTEQFYNNKLSYFLFHLNRFLCSEMLRQHAAYKALVDLTRLVSVTDGDVTSHMPSPNSFCAIGIVWAHFRIKLR